ncbi:hypothetical protein llap_9534 [Limosa lapponica baueri]|uniref:Uncharacterized protein n=1 Tax=Limosa lapponica baueri TaxID=1758121 RepID=A0A2I0U2I0_LIMLA|nr:hypothetical protein llap_9534 [Limosa lapponica baueri]
MPHAFILLYEMIFCLICSETSEPNTESIMQQIRGEQKTSSIWTYAKHLTLSCMTSWSLNWKGMDLMDGPLGG